jgi:YD repeat-containing protein
VTNGLNQYDRAGATNFTYDGRGNLVAAREGGSEKLYWYTSENRLTTAPGAVLSYGPLGRLRQVNGGAWYRHDGDRLVADVRGSIVAAADSVGVVTALQ